MRTLRLLTLLGLLVALSLYQEPTAQANCVSNTLSAYQHETITVSSASIGFTAGLIDNGSGQAQSALVTIETNAIRFWSDGAAPTASVGHPGAVGAVIEVCGFANVKNFRMIRQSADASASVSYFR